MEITNRKTKYASIKKRDPNTNIVYIPDERYLTWYPSRVQENVYINKTLKMSIIMEKDEVTEGAPSMFSIYNITFYKESSIAKDDLRDILQTSDLVICQSYNIHISCIILEIPFVSYKPNKEVKRLLKDIGIEYLQNIYMYIDLYPRYSKKIEKYNEREYQRIIKLKDTLIKQSM